MKLFRLISVYTAVAALILVPAVSAAQTPASSDTSTETTKRARKKAKKTEEQAGGAAAATPSQTPETPPAGAKGAGPGTANRAMPSVSDSEMAAARASGKVWVNTATGVYHKGGRWYGATKQGKFMTEDDAVKAGYRASKGKEQ